MSNLLRPILENSSSKIAYGKMHDDLFYSLSDKSKKDKLVELALFNIIVNIEQAHEKTKEDLGRILEENQDIFDLFEENDLHIKNPALTILVGYDTEIHSSDYLFNGTQFPNKIPILSTDYSINPNAYQIIRVASKRDKATVVDNEGNLVATSVYLNNVSLDELIERNGFFKNEEGKVIDELGERISSYKALGFKSKIATRHESALFVSYKMPGSSIYTLSENENDSETIANIRRMENGYVTCSTVKGEGNIFNT